jgi:hypothetical protein
MKYLRDRLHERSAWAAITVGIAAAAMLPDPWSYGMLAVHIIMALIPDGDPLPKAKP